MKGAFLQEKRDVAAGGALFVLPPSPQGSGGYLIGVSDLLLGVRLSFCLGGGTPPPPPSAPLIHLLSICFCSRKLREETGGGGWGCFCSEHQRS